MLLNLENGLSREIGISVFVAFVLGVFVAYRLLARRVRRRRIVAVELRLEAAWENFKVSWGIPRTRKSVGLGSSLVGGLHTGPQGRVLSMHPLPASAPGKPEPARLPLSSAAAATTQPAPTIETVQQTQISCDI